ncbi:PREDICTED: putative nuclease HARBI1 [Cyphomyrmex costatus]|uniref:putative nuclease HARBI1 n=1 Tax=Cyphomyrmex costatus TaxID=456900 RepID=UPI00085234D2|nr:PREDICTED: putative nuclease HARBI1 [Cyphomyrmex costatus]
MDQRTKVALALAIQLFEGDSFDNDLLTIACSKSRTVCNIAMLFQKEDIQQHFRLGYLCGEEWVRYYLDFDFQRLFRMRKDIFKELVKVIAPSYVPKMQRGDTPAITVDKATLMTLWYLASQTPMESLGDRFGVAPSTVYHELNCIVDILCRLSPKFIVWLKEYECAVVRQQFHDRAGYPGVIGAIDGCHIDILAPADDQDSYTDRKMNHSIILQGGSLWWTKIFYLQVVKLKKYLKSNFCMQEGPESLFYNPYNHLVGDKAYPNRTWVMVPYKDYGNLTLTQRRHNFIHSSTRTVIEHAFGLLKGRWRCLLKLRLKRINRATNFILACCVLHNFCYLHNDDVIQDMVNDDRQMRQQNLRGYHDAANADIAIQKRDRIATLL